MDRLASDLPFIDEDEAFNEELVHHRSEQPFDQTHLEGTSSSFEPLPQQTYLTTVRIHANTNIACHNNQQQSSPMFSMSHNEHNEKYITTKIDIKKDENYKQPFDMNWRSSSMPPTSHVKHHLSKSIQHIKSDTFSTRKYSISEKKQSGKDLRSNDQFESDSSSDEQLKNDLYLNDVELPSNQPNQRFSSKAAANERRLGHRRVDEVTGKVTYKNIESEQIMGSIQLGIKHSLSSLVTLPERDILLPDFNDQERVFMPASGSPTTPDHKFDDFYFTTHMPIAFRYFRALFSIHPKDFVESMTSKPLRELSNPGASGSVFYRTFDDRFIIKTVTKYEANFLHTLLPGYFMVSYENW